MEMVRTVERENSLRQFLKNSFELSSNLIRELALDNLIFVDGKRRFLDYKVKPGMKVSVRLVYEENTYEPWPEPIDVIYEDDQLLVVNKDPLVTIHPTAGTKNGTLLNRISYYEKNQGEEYKVRFINRLDRDTSGLVLVAKTKYMHHKMSEVFIRHEVKKVYEALTEGVAEDHFTVDEPIFLTDGIKHEIRPEGKPSFTEFFTLDRGENWSRIEAIPKTGRTHQIRIHLSHKNHPILGDVLYGREESAPRLMLHCKELHFKDPRDGVERHFFAPLKEDFLEKLRLLKGN
ncbi:RluA family pseudouridine synthase [Guggenheimella bovis]